MDWCRLWHDAPDDPKWRLIARKAGVRVGDVWAVWTRMMVRASASSERGMISGWDDEVEAVALDFEPEDVTAIREAMQGRVLDGDRLSGWDKRQSTFSASQRAKQDWDSREDVCVYVMQAGDLVKIGISSNPVGRADGLSIETGELHNVEHEIWCNTRRDAYKIEQHAHSLISDSRINGEYFSVTSALAYEVVINSARKLFPEINWVEEEAA